MADDLKCPECGSAIGLDAPLGVCPRCVLALMMNGGAETADHDPFGGPRNLPGPEALAGLFPQLEILEPIGRGGMGVVYKARQIKLDRLVALKLIRPESAGDPSFAERFAREARA